MPNWLTFIGPNWCATSHPVHSSLLTEPHLKARCGRLNVSSSPTVTIEIPNSDHSQGALDANGSYAIQCIKKIQNENLHSFCPKQSASDSYNQHVQTWANDVIWGKGCRTWYKDNETGRLRVCTLTDSLFLMNDSRC